ncbi:hypothetical protein SLS62_009149 [Diatrype stigma]|uniref:Uncharacterized protein n=1 Tax=Diatrype stigma TaxID=117547 RepID=A0AAN9UI18_9PEZI
MASASASRAFALRSSLRAPSAPALRQTPRLLFRPNAAARRGYASGAHEAAAQTSDLPWLIGSIAFTVPAAGYLIYKMPSRSGGGKAHHAHHDDGSEAEESSEDSGGDEKQGTETSTNSAKDEAGEGGTEQYDASQKEGKGNPNAGQTDATGGETPPPSADNSSIAEKWDEKKEKHEDYKQKARAGETKVLTASDDAPTKKTQSEDPREDPKGGEGEGAKKGGSN